MKRAIYQVYVGAKSELYDQCVDSVEAYCAAHGIDHIVQTEPSLRIRPGPSGGRSKEAVDRLGYLPIFEKENALALLGEYDQVAVIDADVYIRLDAPNIFDELTDQDDFAGVVERDLPMTPEYAKKLRGYTRGQYGPLKDVDWRWSPDTGAEFINMGVMVMNKSLARFLCGDTPREFLERPEFQRFIDGVGQWKWSTDQTLLNWWLRSCGAGVKPLDWRWNALYSALRPGMVKDAYFVHFFLSKYLPTQDVGELLQ